MKIYMDNAATTRVSPGVMEVISGVMLEDYGNPSSKHELGAVAARRVQAARETIAKTLSCESKEITFTSGGTESNNMALLGVARSMARRGKHIITTRIEHASVYNPLLYLEKQGYEITFLDVDSEGHVSPEAVVAAMRPDTILVSIMYVNNEMGAILPIEAIGKAIKKQDPKVLFHVDAIQAYGKLKISVNRCKIDLLSVSGHKLHGPKGVGFLYIRDKVRVIPLVFGGGQQKDLRSGTENVPGIVGLAKAAELAYANLESNVANMLACKEVFEKRVSEIEGAVLIKGEAPHIAAISFVGITKAETLLHALEGQGIYCSSGSACSSNHPAISGTLKALQLPQEQWESTLRFSFCEANTVEEADAVIEALKEEVLKLKAFTQR